MNGQIQTFEVEYVSDKPSIYLKHGVKYSAFLPLDNQSGNVFAVKAHDDEYFGYPASWFKRVTENEAASED